MEATTTIYRATKKTKLIDTRKDVEIKELWATEVTYYLSIAPLHSLYPTEDFTTFSSTKFRIIPAHLPPWADESIIIVEEVELINFIENL